MKKAILVLLLVVAVAGGTVFAQDEADPKSLVSVNVFGPFFGLFSGYYETALTEDLGLVIAPSYWNVKMSILGSILADDFNMWSAGATIGANYYLSDRTIRGLYAGANADFSYTFIGTEADNFSGMVLGANALLGYRWVWGWFALDVSANLGYSVALFEADLSGLSFTAPAVDGFSYGFGIGMSFALY